jgi:CRISPR-associated protein Cas2
MNKYIIVAYDIKDDHRRNKVCDILLGLGKRVNYSVFECFLKERDVEKMKSSISKNIKKPDDVILYYYLCKDCIEKVEREGYFQEEKSIVKFV